MITFVVSDPLRDRIVITIPSKKQNQYSSYTIRGNPDAVKRLKDRIVVGYGAFGHPMSLDVSSAEDIHAFLVSQQEEGYRFSVVGQKIKTYVIPPKGTMF